MSGFNKLVGKVKGDMKEWLCLDDDELDAGEFDVEEVNESHWDKFSKLSEG